MKTRIQTKKAGADHGRMPVLGRRPYGLCVDQVAL